MIVRPATEADIEAFFGQKPEEMQTTRAFAWAGVVDDRIIALGGVRYHADGGVTGFLNMKPEAARHPVTVHRAALRLLAMWKAMGHRRLRCTVDRRIERAEAWARRLGFEPLHDEDGVWAWRG